MIVTAGELLAEFVSTRTGCGLGETGNFIGPFASGAPAIFIDQAARVGAKAMIYGSVGNDPFGNLIKARLRNDGVCTSQVDTHRDKATGVAFVSYFADGRRVFVFHIEGSAADDIQVTELPHEPFTLHVSGASLSIPDARHALRVLAQRAKELGGKVSFDPNFRSEMNSNSDVSDAVQTILKLSNFLLPSTADLQALFPDVSSDKACRTLLEQGVELVVLKCGSAGVKVYSQSEEFEIAGHLVNEVDPTGAGDCFCGALLGLLDQGYPLRRAATLANAAGAMHVTQRGPMEHNPTLTEIEAFLTGAN